MKKYNIKELEEKLKISKDIDLSKINIDEVDDLNEIRISRRKFKEERIIDFINKTKNPFVFKVNCRLVKLEFTNNGRKAEDAITIHKTRYQYVNEDGKITAIDIYENELKGLAYMEIEFATEEEAKKYTSPDFVIKDVTSDERYKNGSLARFGIPEE